MACSASISTWSYTDGQRRCLMDMRRFLEFARSKQYGWQIAGLSLYVYTSGCHDSAGAKNISMDEKRSGQNAQEV